MKKLKCAILLAASLCTLSSCGATNGFYGKTFTYKKDSVSYKLSEKDLTYGVSYETIIKEQITANNIDWDASKCAGTYFTSHASYEDMISNMESLVKTACNKDFENFTLTVNSYKDRTASFNYLDTTVNIASLKGSDGDDEEDTHYLTMYDSNNLNRGHISIPSYVGAGVVNGKYSCIEFAFSSLGWLTNKAEVNLWFNNSVTYGSSTISHLSWYVYGTISN